MKKILKVLGFIFLILIFVWAVALGYGVHVRSILTPSSKAYVDESILAIVPTWSKDELTKRAGTQMRAVTSKEELDRVFDDCLKLGAFEHYDGATGTVEVSISASDGQVITAPYVAKATFQYGRVEIEIRLIQEDKNWKILRFYVHEVFNMP